MVFRFNNMQNDTVLFLNIHYVFLGVQSLHVGSTKSDHIAVLYGWCATIHSFILDNARILNSVT